MRKSRFSEEQIAYALRQVESGTPATALCRKLAISEETFYRWKRKYAGMGVAELATLPPRRRVPKTPPMFSGGSSLEAAPRRFPIQFPPLSRRRRDHACSGQVRPPRAILHP
jgi:hypothetical protein